MCGRVGQKRPYESPKNHLNLLTFFFKFLRPECPEKKKFNVMLCLDRVYPKRGICLVGVLTHIKTCADTFGYGPAGYRTLFRTIRLGSE